MTALYDFTMLDITGAQIPLERFRGQVALVVNTASQCGFTPQYAGLERLYREWGTSGFAVLGFPCNQFGRQEPGSPAEIAAFCRDKYEISFPLFARLDVNGADAHPLYIWLKDQARGVLGTRRIKWNFTKFLINRDGQPVTRFGPLTKPEQMRRAIERLL